MKITLICTYSNIKPFKVGQKYTASKDRHGVLRFKHSGYGAIIYSDKVAIRGISETFAEFDVVKKSHRKMLVRAFTKCAKERGWGDSKNGAFKSWSGTPYKNAKDWARWWAENYVDRDGNLFEEFAEYYNGDVIDQSAIDGFVDEELDSL